MANSLLLIIINGSYRKYFIIYTYILVRVYEDIKMKEWINLQIYTTIAHKITMQGGNFIKKKPQQQITQSAANSNEKVLQYCF